NLSHCVCAASELTYFLACVGHDNHFNLKVCLPSNPPTPHFGCLLDSMQWVVDIEPWSSWIHLMMIDKLSTPVAKLVG
ncbi:hypothetical protein DERF_010945, partial [Dermatophagoides farinae]